MSNNSFYAIRFDQQGDSVTWHNKFIGQKLIIDQILLNWYGDDDGYRVVQASTGTCCGSVKTTIAVLNGDHNAVQLHLVFPRAPVTFRLSEGDGEVHIHGHIEG